jgi:hypothetical protein
MRKYRNLHPEKSRMANRKSYHKYKEKRVNYARFFRSQRRNDPIRLEKYKKWCRDYMRKRKITDLHFYIRKAVSTRIIMSLQRGVAKVGHTVELLGCTIPELKSYLESKWLVGMSWENYGRGDDKWHIDHVLPCKFFNLADPQQQRTCFNYRNLQPLWAKDNLSKGAKIL